MASKSTSRAFPGFEHIYRIITPGDDASFRVDLEVSIPEVISLTRGECSPSDPVVATWAGGKPTPLHVVWTTLAIPVLVGGHALEVLRKEESTGWSTYKVDLLGKSGRRIPGFVGLSAIGRCGPIDNRLSKRVQRRLPGGVFERWKGLKFGAATWDGSDIFMPIGDMHAIFVVESVKQAWERAKVDGVCYQSLESIERLRTEMQ